MLAALVASGLGAAAPPATGLVVTAAGRVEGKVAIVPGGLSVAGRKIKPGGILLARFVPKGRTFRQPHVVRMINGEVWPCEILKLTGGKLTIRSPLFGTGSVHIEGVAALEFRANLPVPDRRLEPKTLYRRTGEPLPGELIWINRKKIAIDSLLGALSMSRKTIARYVVAREQRSAVEAGLAEVTFLDGSVLRGKVTFGDRKLTLAHAKLGEVSIAAPAVRSIVNSVPGVTYLTDLPYRIKSFPPLSARVETLEGSPVATASAAMGGRFVRCVQILAGNEFQYSLPGPRGRDASLRASLVAMPGARGDARVEIIAGGKTVFDQTIGPGQTAPVLVSVALGKGGSFSIRVTFGRRLRFPCGVVLGEPHVIRMAKTAK